MIKLVASGMWELKQYVGQRSECYHKRYRERHIVKAYRFLGGLFQFCGVVKKQQPAVTSYSLTRTNCEYY